MDALSRRRDFAIEYASGLGESSALEENRVGGGTERYERPEKSEQERESRSGHEEDDPGEDDRHDCRDHRYARSFHRRRRPGQPDVWRRGGAGLGTPIGVDHLVI